MTWCRIVYRYLRFWWRTPIQWGRILHEGGTTRLARISVSFLIAFIFVLVPDHVVPRAVSDAIAAIFAFIFVCLLAEFFYTYHETLRPRMMQFYANELRNPGFAWSRNMEAIPLDPPLGNRENPPNHQLGGLHQRQIDVQGAPELFRGQQLNQQQQNPQPVRYREVYLETRPTDRVRSRTQQGQSSRPSSSHTQSQPTVRESARPSLNPQPTVTGYRDMSSEINRARSLLTVRDDGQRSRRGQDIEMQSFVGGESRGEQGESSPHSCYPINYEASLTDTNRSRMQQGQSSRPSSSYTQAQPSVRESLNRAWPSLNPQQNLTGVRDKSSDLARVRSLLTFMAEGQRSCRGQSTEMQSFVGAEGSGEQGESSSHPYYPINYETSLSRSTKYGCPELSQQKLQTGSIDDSSTRKSESDDSNRSSRGKGEDNSSNKSSPEKDGSRALDAASSQGGSKASNKSSPDKNESNSPPRSSPGKDQSGASNANSPQKPESTESSPHSRMQIKTSESSSLQQTASLSPRSSSIIAKSTVIKMSLSGVGLGESNVPIKTHKSSSSKSSCQQKDMILTEKTEDPPMQKITKQAPASETSLTETSISKRKVSSGEEQHSDLESFSSPKKKVPKSSSEISPKPSTSGEPGVHSLTRRVIYSVKRKRETSSEEEDGSPTQSKMQSCNKPWPKIPKIDEEADDSSPQSKRQSSSKPRPKNLEDADSESSN